MLPLICGRGGEAYSLRVEISPLLVFFYSILEVAAGKERDFFSSNLFAILCYLLQLSA